jgi:hypothetical protein
MTITRPITQPTELPDYQFADNGDKRWLIVTRLNGHKYMTVSQIKRRMQAFQQEIDDLESELNRLTLTYNVPKRGRG